MENVYEKLSQLIVNAFNIAFLAVLGKDLIFCSINNKIDHLFLSNIPWDIASLIGELSKVTNKIFGAAKNPNTSETWAIIHLNRLSNDWEVTSNRLILETTVINISSALEDFLNEIVQTNIKAFIINKYPEGAKFLNEFRATRNCLVHNQGKADQKYLDENPQITRVNKIGKQLPLDWNYIYDNTARIINFARLCML
ncbi:MAG: hypothetical protein GX075_05970 [Firmicutes bacterium]|nr:hypothetical protein [Bacillota bacterium]